MPPMINPLAHRIHANTATFNGVETPENLSRLIDAVPQDVAEAWWNDLVGRALTEQNGPRRDLTSAEDLSRLCVLNDVGDGKLLQTPVTGVPDPRMLYVYAQAGRLLAAPTGEPDKAYQIQVNAQNERACDWMPMDQRSMEQTFTDPRQGIGYWFMRAANFLTFGSLFSTQLADLDRAAENTVAMRSTVGRTFLTPDEAEAEWNDPSHLAALKQVGFVKGNEPVRAGPDDPVPDPAIVAQKKRAQRAEDLTDFAENILDLFGSGMYPTQLADTRMTARPPRDPLSVDARFSNIDVGGNDLCLMAFLATADPTLDYYQKPRLADFGTLSGELSGTELVNDRFAQIFDGMMGRPGALDAVCVPCEQAVIKVQNILENAKSPAEFADTILNGLVQVQKILQESTEPNDRFLQAAALAGPVANLLSNQPELLEALQQRGFEPDFALMDGAYQFHQMHTKALRAESEIMEKAIDRYDKDAVPLDDMLENVAAIAQSRYQMLNISKNGLQTVVRMYSKHGLTEQINEKIEQSQACQALSEATYGELGKAIGSNAGMVKMCAGALSKAPEPVASNQGKVLSMNEPEHQMKPPEPIAPAGPFP